MPKVYSDRLEYMQVCTEILASVVSPSKKRNVTIILTVRWRCIMLFYSMCSQERQWIALILPLFPDLLAVCFYFSRENADLVSIPVVLGESRGGGQQRGRRDADESHSTCSYVALVSICSVAFWLNQLRFFTVWIYILMLISVRDKHCYDRDQIVPHRTTSSRQTWKTNKTEHKILVSSLRIQAPPWTEKEQPRMAQIELADQRV